MSDILRDFDKKNEIPKVKISKFATGGICNDAIFPKIDAFSQIDEIVKDIRDRQDNAIAMEFTKCIGELLRKNGVVPKMTEYTRNFETDNTFETRYGVSIDELDFSEHDKVFEDKIAELKKDYKTASELLGKYQQENESLKKRVVELEDFSCQAEQETESLVEKLKQCIAELKDKIGDRDEINRCLREQIAESESKESVNPMRIEFYADNGEMLTPLEVANSLINLGYERPLKENEVSVSGENSVMVNTFSVNDLKEIADYLNVYSRHHQEDTKTISF